MSDQDLTSQDIFELTMVMNSPILTENQRNERQSFHGDICRDSADNVYCYWGDSWEMLDNKEVTSE